MKVAIGRDVERSLTPIFTHWLVQRVNFPKIVQIKTGFATDTKYRGGEIASKCSIVELFQWHIQT